MNETNWKTLGWTITRKLLYYALIVIVAAALFICAFALMTMAEWIFFILGLLVAIATVGGLITLGIREVLFYLKKSNQTHNL